MEASLSLSQPNRSGEGRSSLPLSEKKRRSGRWGWKKGHEGSKQPKCGGSTHVMVIWEVRDERMRWADRQISKSHWERCSSSGGNSFVEIYRKRLSTKTRDLGFVTEMHYYPRSVAMLDPHESRCNIKLEEEVLLISLLDNNVYVQRYCARGGYMYPLRPIPIPHPPKTKVYRR